MATRLRAIPHRPASTRHVWKELAAHYKKLRELHLRQIFQEEIRGEHPTAEAPGIDIGASLRLMCSATFVEFTPIRVAGCGPWTTGTTSKRLTRRDYLT